MNLLQTGLIVALLGGAAATDPPSPPLPQQPTGGVTQECLLAADPTTFQQLGLTSDQVRSVEQLRSGLKGAEEVERAAGERPTGDHDKDGRTAQEIVDETTPEGQVPSDERITTPDTTNANAPVVTPEGELASILTPEQLQRWRRMCLNKR
jgi:hypothetical protein